MEGDPVENLPIPTPGFGTLEIDSDHVTDSVRTALEMGYRHVDTAEMYGNEAAVGAGIAESDVPRDELFLATKVLHPKSADSADPDGLVADARACLDRLGVDAVDLLYLHWPAEFDLANAFEALERVQDAGLTEYCGVCNFTVDRLEQTRSLPGPSIDSLQVEMHPLLQQERLREYCTEHDIAMVAYAPVIRGAVTDVPELREIGTKHGASPFQVSLAWLVAKGIVPIPKATSEAHIRENWAARTLELDAEDVAVIDAIDCEERQVDPPFATW